MTPFDGLLAFAVLHHLPGQESPYRFLKAGAHADQTGGRFYSQRVADPKQPEIDVPPAALVEAGLSEDQVEAGDVLLDWRQSTKGSPQSAGLRYVHMFTETDLEALAVENRLAGEIHVSTTMGIPEIWVYIRYGRRSDQYPAQTSQPGRESHSRCMIFSADFWKK